MIAEPNSGAPAHALHGRRVGRWIRRVALWFGPALLLTLVWQIWDRYEESRLKTELQRLQNGATPPDTQPASADNAQSYYLAATLLAHSHAPGSLSPLRNALLSALSTGDAPSAETMAAVAQITGRNTPVVWLMNEAARLPSYPPSPPHTFAARGLPFQVMDRASSLSMLEQLHRNQADAAAVSLVNRIAALRTFDRQRNLLNALLKISTIRTMLDDSASLFGRRDVSSERLLEIERALADVFGTRELEEVVRGDTEELYENGATLWGDRASLSRLGIGIPWRPIWRRWFVNVLQNTQRAVEIARMPWPERWRDMEQLSSREVLMLGIDAVPGHALVDGYRGTARAFARATARVRAARVAIRAELERRERNVPPKRLDDLPGVAGNVELADPFTGRPLVYVSSAQEILVYSVGADGHDDGGRIAQEPAVDLRSQPDTPDVGMRVPIR